MINEQFIKDAFWKTFHKSGEIWFNYFGDESECEESTNEKWMEFIENLRANEVNSGEESNLK